MTLALRILIVGGYGVFGARLVQLLEGDARLTLLVAGRSAERARAFCAGRPGAARLIPLACERTRVDARALAAWAPGLVVDASGPFQAYGPDGHVLVAACIEAGVPYVDLADGSDFVDAVLRFDGAARDAGVFVLSGASSFPVLTAAAARRLSADMRQVHSIRGGIAPSPFAGVGTNVIRAIASYAGQPVHLTRAGRVQIGHPFTDSMRFSVAVPGRVPLGQRRYSLVDVPDLRVLAREWPQAIDIWMGAAPVPDLLHGMLSALAWLVRLRLLPHLSWLARAIELVTNHVRWGEHQGGMFVVVEGQGKDGRSVQRQWHLLAEGDDGPLIPCMAVAALVHRVLDGRPPHPGARAAVRDLELADYEALFRPRTIWTGVRHMPLAEDTPLYRGLLGSAWDELPPPVRALHETGAMSAFDGRCTVRRGRHPLAWAVARLTGFPDAGDDLPISVRLEARGSTERWTRSVGQREFSSLQWAGRGRAQWHLQERFGAVTVDLALAVEQQALTYRVRRWTLLGLPMPRWLGPRARARESADGERFCFDVELCLPWVGLVVHYRGWLLPAAPEARQAGLSRRHNSSASADWFSV